MFLHVSVILFTGGSAPLHAGKHTPLGPEAGIPPDKRQAHPHTKDRHPPGPGTPPPHRNQSPPRADTPSAVHAGRYGQQAGGTHPTGMQSYFKM